MIISFRHKFVFIAVPKTASQSFRRALRPSLAKNDWEQCGLFEKKSFPVEALAQIEHGHLTYRQIEPFLLPPLLAKKFFKFCTVRNPYKRFISYCYFINRANRSMQNDPLGEIKKTLSDKRVMQNVMLRPQSEFLIDETGRVVADFICRFENLQADFDTVCRELQLPNVILPPVNVSSHAPPEELYDAELKAMVGEFYRNDFKLFGYEREV